MADPAASRWRGQRGRLEVWYASATDRPSGDGIWLQGDSVSTGPDRLTGTAGEFAWDLAWSSDEAPIWTLPRATWEREALPSAQVVVAPRARFTGTITAANRGVDFDGLGNIA